MYICGRWALSRRFSGIASKTELVMKMISVFKTSVLTNSQVAQLKPALDKIFDAGERWNFDLEDRENIFRIESTATKAGMAVGILKASGFNCEELMG